MANQGQAASYYQMDDQQNDKGYQQQQANMGYTQQPEYDQNQKYQQAPPNYGQNYGNGNGNIAQQEMGGKQSFDETFKVTKPKYNDIWAAILVRCDDTAISVGEYCLTYCDSSLSSSQVSRRSLVSLSRVTLRSKVSMYVAMQI